MIKTNKGKTEIDGRVYEIMEDYTAVTESIYDFLREQDLEEEKAKDMLQKAYNLGLMSPEEAIKTILEELLSLKSEEKQP